jgi:hypothetical protein
MARPLLNNLSFTVTRRLSRRLGLIRGMGRVKAFIEGPLGETSGRLAAVDESAQAGILEKEERSARSSTTETRHEEFRFGVNVTKRISTEGARKGVIEPQDKYDDLSANHMWPR